MSDHSQEPAGSPSPAPPRRQRMRYELKVLLVVALIVVGRIVWLYAARGPRLPTVSLETTYATEPLKADGTVDYIAAYNAEASKGVTRENNAAIPLIQLIGGLYCEMTAGSRDDSCSRLLEVLGAQPLDPARRLRLEPILEAARTADGSSDPREEYGKAGDAPWLPSQLPVAAKVIEANSEALDAVVAASRLPRYHMPQVAGSAENTFSSIQLLPSITCLREATRMLKARGMMRLAEGKGALAGEDFMACHRLARLQAQELMLVSRLTASWIETNALASDATLAHHGKLDRQQLAEYRRRLRELPPLPLLGDSMLAERFYLLEAMASVASGRRRIQDLVKESSLTSDPKMAGGATFALYANTDEVMRTGNEAYDALIRVNRLPTHAERQRESQRLNEHWRDLAAASNTPSRVLKSIAVGTSRQLGREVGNSIVAIALPNVAPPRVVVAEEKRRGLTDLALQLAEYKAEHGSYPEKLDSLTAQTPKTDWNELLGGLPQYKRTEKGYTLSEPAVPTAAEEVETVISIEMPIPEKKSAPPSTAPPPYGVHVR